ncbi:MAG: leucine--tRNA ligase [bacterium]|nr:leucine--tRNA ligase [bacterium]
MSQFVPTFQHEIIEPKWQKRWYDSTLFQAVDFSSKPKWYNLVEFPYPSGAGMHVGHIRAYSSLEVLSRKRRMEGYNVLFPIGFDAFGLPTENYAIQSKIHPRVITDRNIETFTKQLQAVGFSFDFKRVVDTTDPEYYKYTQWIFLQLFKAGLVYRNKTYVNFCPHDLVVLSNEESQGGVCDRCGTEVVQMEKDVWFLKITAYADKLLQGLQVLDASSRIKIEQEKWIGKSEGASIHFPLFGLPSSLEVFTTRPDTIFGATFMVISPEHPIISSYESRIQNMDEVRNYQESAKKKTEFERTQMNKEKTGVLLQGLQALNPATNQPIPIFIADYVTISYGTGAIMAVPGHDDRDYAFASVYQLPIIEVILGGDISKEAYTSTDSGILVNSGFLNGLCVEEAKIKITEYLEKNNLGHATKQFKMKDWAFNRQRYWGEPIPLIHCPTCGVVPVPEDQLPVRLPMVEAFQPTDTGESPLANIDSFVNCTCPTCNGPAKRETDTMPQWAGSSWYYLRYMDPFNKTEFASKELLRYWGQIDWYNGGMEHVTRHLIYSRFWNQFLYDQGHVPFNEPYLKRTAQGLILGSDGEKMSKSRGNVVNPMEIVSEFGADTLRMFILFIGDYEMPTPWNETGAKGCRRFLDKVWRLQEKIVDSVEYSQKSISLMHKTIKTVSEDYEAMKFNTAIAKMMILVNELTSLESVTTADMSSLLKLLYPVAPHICEEIWERLGHQHFLQEATWPNYDEQYLVEHSLEIVVNINGKIRERFSAPATTKPSELEKMAFECPRIIELLAGQTVKKVIVVPGKLVNIVI